MGDIDEDLTSKCSDLKTYIEDLESEFSRQLQELSRTLEINDNIYNEDFKQFRLHLPQNMKHTQATLWWTHCIAPRYEERKNKVW